MLGAAAGAARLLGLTTETTRQTLSITASQTGTLLAQLGTMSKPFHGGLAAECAIVSVDLAAMGFTASPVGLETRWGYFQALGGGHDDGRIRGKLGRPWAFADRGVWLKPWPTGSLGHPALTKMIELITEHDLHPGQVAGIRVRTSKSIRDDTLFHHRPTERAGSQVQSRVRGRHPASRTGTDVGPFHRRLRQPARHPGHHKEGRLRTLPCFRCQGRGLHARDLVRRGRAGRRSRRRWPHRLWQGQPGQSHERRRGGGKVSAPAPPSPVGRSPGPRRPSSSCTGWRPSRTCAP